MFLLHVGSGGPSWLDWAIEPDVLILCVFLAAAYLYTVVRLRERISGAGRVKRSQVITFLLGVVLLYGATGSPMHELAETYLASAHMLQHVLLMLGVAPLLLAGTPSWVWQALFRATGTLAVARMLTRPLVAMSIFNAVFLLTHLPVTVDLQLREGEFHLLVHAAQLGSGLLMWSPILSRLPELPRISYPAQMVYLFVQSLLPAIVAAFITFSEHVFYASYETAPRIWGISPIEDQQFAGLIMKLLGSVILWIFIGVAFFKWFEREEAEARGQQSSDGVGELEELGLTER